LGGGRKKGESQENSTHKKIHRGEENTCRNERKKGSGTAFSKKEGKRI